MGIGVDREEAASLASVLGRGVGILPFNYLGVLVGCNMACIDSWK